MAFNPDVDLPGKLHQFFKLGPGMWHQFVEEALKRPEQKFRDPDWLASALFYLNHPERRPSNYGNYLPIETGQTASIAEYYDWKRKVTALISHLKVNPVLDFTPVITRQLVLIDHPRRANHHMFEAAFQLSLTLNPDLADPGLYEYRQLIKGGMWAQKGVTSALGEWTATGSLQQALQSFWGIPASTLSSLEFGATSLPVGLYDNAWKEDGVISAPPRFYGHRDSVPFPSVGGERDEYLPRQRDGHRYFLGDRPQFAGAPLQKVMKVDNRIKGVLNFRGLVVKFDRPPGSAGRKVVDVVQTREWKLQFDKVVTNVTPVQYK